MFDIASALLEGGIPSIEVTMSTPKAIAGIEALADKLGDKAIIGVGTCIDPATVRDAIAAGRVCRLADVRSGDRRDDDPLWQNQRAGGTRRPKFSALLRRADVVKVFPATTLGPGYFKDILAPLPQLRLTPTGGVDIKTTPQWIKAGAVFVGAGSALVSKEAMDKGDWKTITANAKAFVEAVKAGRAN